MAASYKRRRRAYRTQGSPGRPGRSPVPESRARLRVESRGSAAKVAKAFKDVEHLGKRADRVRHLQGDLYEVRIKVEGLEVRVIFASEGRHGQILLSLHLFRKQSMKTPQIHIKTAERRLKDWRQRGTP